MSYLYPVVIYTPLYVEMVSEKPKTASFDAVFAYSLTAKLSTYRLLRY